MSSLISGLFSHPPANMSDVDPTAAVVSVDIEEAAPSKTTIRYSESNRVRNRHVSVDYSSVIPGDIGGLYAAISAAITADLNRIRRERKGSKSGQFFSGSTTESDTPLLATDCELKVELCRLLDTDGTLFIPPVKETSVFRQKHAQLQSSNTQDARDKKYDLIAFLLDRDVKSAWEHLQDGLFFEEGEGWPWYSLLVTFSHESRLDKVVKYQGRLVMAEIDPQTFFPRMPSPPPTPPSPSSPQFMHRQSMPPGIEVFETVEVSAKPRRTRTVVEGSSKSRRPDKPSRTASQKASGKYADVKAKSRSAFTIGSLVKAQR